MIKSISCKNAALLIFALVQFHSQAFAQDPCREPAGRFASIEGKVQIRGDEQQAWQAAKQADRLCKGDTIRVGELSRAAVVLINEAVIRLDQNTTMRLVDVSGKKEDRSLIDLARGAIKSFIRKPRLLSVNTPYLNGSIEGTEFQVSVDADRASILVLEGRVLASNSLGNVAVQPGEVAEAQAGGAPTSRILVKPRDAVQWTLYYPPILAAAASQGDSAAEFDALNRVAESERDAAYHLRRAALLLSVGRQDEAQAAIDTALNLDPKAGLGHALRAVIHVVRNEREQALSEADKGVALSDTASTRIALSYAQQADFRIEAARDTLLTAVNNHPEDALAWARLSELQLMLGNKAQSRAAADKATSLAPGLARTQLVKGFAALSEYRDAEARSAFEQAIELSPADPLAHLGLGLAHISSGQLESGRGELEVAVALDSNQALLRSYLGKAYFEEKRTPLDEQQFGIAKSLDPLDPTPYLYEGIRKHTQNRPVEALEEVQQSIALNDNRAVYRSRLLLDSDLAARSASLARVYENAGFQQLALVEGWNSVNTDPGNFSAHRFLADSYSVLPRHEIARVSELLQSQLLQPLNLAPIQPRQSEGSLYLISAGGPATVSANEFNSLFNRNQSNVLVNGMVGEHDTYSGDLIVAGIRDNVSFSLGATRFSTDGFRENSDQKDDIANAFVQMEMSPYTSLQLEYRYRETTTGDLQLNFFADDFLPDLRNKGRTDTYRAGLRHVFSPGSILLGSVMYQKDDGHISDVLFESPFTGENVLLDIREPDDKGIGAELQYLHRSANINVTAGIGYFDLDRSQVSSVSSDPVTCDAFSIPDIYEFCTDDSTDLSAKHKNAYVYSNIGMTRDAILTVGLSADSFDTEDSFSSESKDQFNPKFGLTWNVLPGTTFRAAAFRAFKRTLLTQQTLEPTQVAGFNQFFDDIESTDSRRYGIAADQKFSRQSFGGVELSKRDLKVPLYVSGFGVQRKEWEERLARAYLYAAPHDRLALSMEYQFEHIERPESFTYEMDAKTHKVPLGLRYFDPSGWTFAIKGTYIHQDGEFQYFGVCCESGTSSFWLADATVSYRLPKRQGFLVFGATNLFDEDSSYQETDFNNPTLQPKRMVFGRLSLTFQ